MFPAFQICVITVRYIIDIFEGLLQQIAHCKKVRHLLHHLSYPPPFHNVR